jgi:hypothetical protein
MVDPNAPAFPAEPKTQNDLGITYRGLTKRELLAAMAMQGILSGDLITGLIRGGGKEETFCRDISIMAVEHADALIAELNKNG